MKSVKIAVAPAEALTENRRLFDALGELFSLQFEPRAEGNLADCAAALLFGASRDDAGRVTSSGVRCLAFLKDAPVGVKSETADISMINVPYLDQSFRGR